MLSAEAEARVFWRMRSRVVSTLVEQTFSGARLRLSLIVALSSFLWVVLFCLFLEGFPTTCTMKRCGSSSECSS